MKTETKYAKIMNLAKQLFIRNFHVNTDGNTVHYDSCVKCSKACINAAKTFYKTIETEDNESKSN